MSLPVAYDTGKVCRMKTLLMIVPLLAVLVLAGCESSGSGPTKTQMEQDRQNQMDNMMNSEADNLND